MKPEDMEVFKLSHEVVLETYKLTKDFPNEEKFGLVSQMRRSSSSVIRACPLDLPYCPKYSKIIIRRFKRMTPVFQMQSPERKMYIPGIKMQSPEKKVLNPVFLVQSPGKKVFTLIFK